MIINITEIAKVALDNMIKDYNVDSNNIRVYLKSIAWYGPIFNVALDDPTEKDEVFKVDDYLIIINKDLASKFEVVNIYYKSTQSYGDFHITTDLVWKDEYHYSDWAKPW